VVYSALSTPKLTIEEAMSKLVAEMQSTLPTKIDDVTTIVAIDYHANRLATVLSLADG
jgi:hypothetical protein